MKNYERKLTLNGKDTGVRENDRGALYINHQVFFSDPKVQSIIKRLTKADIVKKSRTIVAK